MENVSSTRKELVKELKEYVSDGISEEILLKFEEFCQSFLLKPSEVVDEWVAFAARKVYPVEPDFNNLHHFEKECLSKKLTKTPIRNVKSFASPRGSTSSGRKDLSDNKLLNNYDTPEQIFSKKRQMTPETPPSVKTASTNSTKYENRTSKGDVICNWGESSSCCWLTSNPNSVSVELYDSEQALTERYQFMFEKLKIRACILNDTIEEMASKMKNKHHIEEWSDFTLPSPNELTVVGRICSNSNGKLNASSIILEGSRETCSGKTILLDISHLSSGAFFPGQIIAGKGKNLLGRSLLMSSLFEPLYLPFPEKIPSGKTENVQIIVAAGPFTTADNLAFEPLNDLLKYITTNKPHACILIGPLVDTNQEIEKYITEELAITYNRCFSKMEEARKESGTNIVIVSSSSDILQDYIYPTPPYVYNEAIHKLQFVSDPSILSIDGVLIGVTATDVIHHLSKEEMALPGATDRLGRQAQHILTQHSFYPLYPPNETMNIDYGHFEDYAKLPVTPHILVLPSDLRCFLKNVNGCFCVNPERLTKGAGGGNFARIQVDTNSCMDASRSSIVDYIKAEIVKI